MNRLAKFQQIVRGMNQVLPKMTTHSPHRPTPGPAADHPARHRCWTQATDRVKLRTGVQERVNLAHRLLPDLGGLGAALVTGSRGRAGVGAPRPFPF